MSVNGPGNFAGPCGSCLGDPVTYLRHICNWPWAYFLEEGVPSKAGEAVASSA